jgi:hypothetical protein
MSTEIIRTEISHLPPLPRIVAAVPAPPVSDRGENLLMAITVLLVGTTALAWTIRLDHTESQSFVSTAAVLAVIMPLAVFTLLRATSRRR